MINKSSVKIELIKVENGGYVIASYGDLEYIAATLDEAFDIIKKFWK
jgi:hypothetical protein